LLPLLILGAGVGVAIAAPLWERDLAEHETNDDVDADGDGRFSLMWFSGGDGGGGGWGGDCGDGGGD
jgi:hypothetical protein